MEGARQEPQDAEAGNGGCVPVLGSGDMTVKLGKIGGTHIFPQ